MVSIHLRHISQTGNLPQIGVKINNTWTPHLDNIIYVKWRGRFVYPEPVLNFFGKETSRPSPHLNSASLAKEPPHQETQDKRHTFRARTISGWFPYSKNHNINYILGNPNDPCFDWNFGLVLKGWHSNKKVIWVPGKYGTVLFASYFCTWSSCATF